MFRNTHLFVKTITAGISRRKNCGRPVLRRARAALGESLDGTLLINDSAIETSDQPFGS
jgi:hypothetical protein